MSACDGTVKDLLPEMVAGTLDEGERGQVEAHLARCPECARELELLGGLRAGRATLPPALARRIAAGVRDGLREPVRRRRPARRWIPAWGLAAAAVVVLALATPSMMERVRTTDAEAELYSEVEASASEVWLSTDPLVAGAPNFEGLSDEALQQLLEEMEG